MNYGVVAARLPPRKCVVGLGGMCGTVWTLPEHDAVVSATMLAGSGSATPGALAVDALASAVPVAPVAAVAAFEADARDAPLRGASSDVADASSLQAIAPTASAPETSESAFASDDASGNHPPPRTPAAGDSARTPAARSIDRRFDFMPSR